MTSKAAKITKKGDITQQHIVIFAVLDVSFAVN